MENNGQSRESEDLQLAKLPKSLIKLLKFRNNDGDRLLECSFSNQCIVPVPTRSDPPTRLRRKLDPRFLATLLHESISVLDHVLSMLLSSFEPWNLPIHLPNHPPPVPTNPVLPLIFDRYSNLPFEPSNLTSHRPSPCNDQSCYSSRLLPNIPTFL